MLMHYSDDFISIFFEEAVDYEGAMSARAYMKGYGRSECVQKSPILFNAVNLRVGKLSYIF